MWDCLHHRYELKRRVSCTKKSQGVWTKWNNKTPQPHYWTTEHSPTPCAETTSAPGLSSCTNVCPESLRASCPQQSPFCLLTGWLAQPGLVAKPKGIRAHFSFPTAPNIQWTQSRWMACQRKVKKMQWSRQHLDPVSSQGDSCSLYFLMRQGMVASRIDTPLSFKPQLTKHLGDNNKLIFTV